MLQKKFWNADKIVGMVAFLVSIGTLFTFIYQTNIMRKHQKASVLPYLEIWNAQINNNYSLNLSNNGIGPAFIDDIKIIFEDSIFHTDPQGFFSYLEEKCDTINHLSFMYSNIGKGRLIPAGKSIPMIKITDAPNGIKTLIEIFGNQKAIVEIRYKSIYDEVWAVQGIASPPKKIK